MARKNGRIGGRPPALNENQQRLALTLYQESKHSIQEICQMLDISKTTLYTYLNKAKVAHRSSHINPL